MLRRNAVIPIHARIAAPNRDTFGMEDETRVCTVALGRPRYVGFAAGSVVFAFRRSAQTGVGRIAGPGAEEGPVRMSALEQPRLVPDSRVALVHDSFTQWGGAERVAAAFHRMFPEAPVYTLAVNRAILPSEMADAEFRTSFLQDWPGMPALGAFKRYLPLLPKAAESLRVEGFDLVISSSSAFAHGAQIPTRNHVAYIHNTMRFAWDYGDYMRDVAWPGLVKAAGRIAVPTLQAWDRAAGRRPGMVIANSRVVAERIGKRWGRTAAVLPPPVDVEAIGVSLRPRRYFCVVSRLVPYKRIDLAIAAAAQAGERLVVVGDGPDRPRLRALAGPQVAFVGWVSEAEKLRILGEAHALVMPGVEDFGMVSVEANAAGTPVLAQAAGGALDSQQPGVTGVLTAADSPEAFAAGMREIRAASWDRSVIRAHSERFSTRAFRLGMTRNLRQWQESGGERLVDARFQFA